MGVAEQTQELLGLTNQVPFDDRPNRYAGFDDISPVQVQDYLRLSGSRLSEIFFGRCDYGRQIQFGFDLQPAGPEFLVEFFEGCQ